MNWLTVGSFGALVLAIGMIILQCEQKKRIQQNLEFLQAEIQVLRDAEYVYSEIEKERQKINEIARQNIQAVRNISDTPSLVHILNDIFNSMHSSSSENPIRPSPITGGTNSASGSVPSGGRVHNH